MKCRSSWHGSIWYTACGCIRGRSVGCIAAKSFLWLFYDLFPVFFILRLGLTLYCGPSLWHLQLSTCGLILWLNFAAWTSGFKKHLGAEPLFPPCDILPEAMKKSRATTAYFSSPDSQAAPVHRWLEMAGYRRLWLKFQLLQELSFLCAISYK